MKIIRFGLLALLLVPALLRAASPAETAATELLAADNAFCAKAQQDGVPAAFLSLATEHMKMLSVKSGTGVDIVKRAFAGWPAGATLTWAPAYAESSAAGDLGYTYGRYRYRMVVNGAETDAEGGTYVTIWKRQVDGSWKILLDGGTPDPKPAKS